MTKRQPVPAEPGHDEQNKRIIEYRFNRIIELAGVISEARVLLMRAANELAQERHDATAIAIWDLLERIKDEPHS